MMAVPAVTAAPALTDLHAFMGGADGASPGNLIQAMDGNFYGTTAFGGTGCSPVFPNTNTGCGTVFKLTPLGAITVLHTFVGGADGAHPGGLIQATDGNFYGTTRFAGASSDGTVFKMTPAGIVTVLHAFSGAEGFLPGALIQGTDGNFYGTTTGGGTSGHGTVFRITPLGAITILHTFVSTDGTSGAALLQATDGNIYGTIGSSLDGGCPQMAPPACGTVFKMTTAGTFTTLYAFTNGTDGQSPDAALVQATDGNFYGTTSSGGSHGAGTAFQLTPGGTITVLHAFADKNDGAIPRAALIQATDGNFYGTTSSGGGTRGGGTIFKMTPAGTVTVLHAFSGGADGFSPGALIKGTDGNFYGTTSQGGAFRDGGVAFRLAPKVVESDFDGDGTSDVAVFRPSNSTWYILESQTSSLSAVPWGASGDIPVPGDYDGDGRTDLAVYRPGIGTWFILQSSTGTLASVGWGTGEDLPVPADFDGDGRTDVAVYRPSTGTWFILQSSTGSLASVGWGTGGDLPVPADFDGDGRTDLAVYRPSTGQWFILQSSTGTLVTVQWGTSGDLPVPADFDGDGKTDLAVYRHSTGTWFIFRSSTSTLSMIQWGDKTDDDAPILEHR